MINISNFSWDRGSPSPVQVSWMDTLIWGGCHLWLENKITIWCDSKSSLPYFLCGHQWLTSTWISQHRIQASGKHWMSTMGQVLVRCWWHKDEQDTTWLTQGRYCRCRQSQQNSSACSSWGYKMLCEHTEEEVHHSARGESSQCVGWWRIIGDKTRKSQIKVPQSTSH